MRDVSKDGRACSLRRILPVPTLGGLARSGWPYGCHCQILHIAGAYTTHIPSSVQAQPRIAVGIVSTRRAGLARESPVCRRAVYREWIRWSP
jgi:hypothetical protein